MTKEEKIQYIFEQRANYKKALKFALHYSDSATKRIIKEVEGKGIDVNSLFVCDTHLLFLIEKGYIKLNNNQISQATN